METSSRSGGILPSTTSTTSTGAVEDESQVTVTRALVYWLPVIVALCVFAQVAVLGLRPALLEERRLADATETLVGRYDESVEESTRLSRLLRAQKDPVLLERERRALRVDPKAPGQKQ